MHAPIYKPLQNEEAHSYCHDVFHASAFTFVKIFPLAL